jgi:hypothetical protein
MVQTAQQTNGAANGQEFPFGIDPRDFGLGRLQYDQALDHHRRMAHHDWKHQEHITHMHEMDEARARKEAADSELAARQWWLEPLNAFASVAGFCFWIVCWGYLILSFMLWLGEASARRDAQWCLNDVAKCEKAAGPDFKAVKP